MLPQLTPRRAWEVLSGILFIIGIAWLIFEPGFEPLYLFVGSAVAMVASRAFPDKKQQSGEQPDAPTSVSDEEPDVPTTTDDAASKGSSSDSKTTKGAKVHHIVSRLSVGTRIAVNVGALIIFVILLFFPAEDESLIIVANFADESAGQYAGIDPDNYIYSELIDRIADDGLDIRVKRLDITLDANTVRPVGWFYNATLVLWGQYDAVGITPYVERIKQVRASRTDEEGQSVLVDPERIQFSVAKDLPTMSSYLVLFTLGADLRINEQWDPAMTYLTGAIESVSGETVTAQPDEAYYERGNVYYYTGRYENAVLDYTQAITLGYEPLAFPYITRGLSYANLDEEERAIEDFDRAIEIDPEDAIAYLNRGSTYGALGEHERAIEDFDRAIERDPEYASAYVGRGNAYGALGEHERAINDYDRAIERDPEYAGAYYSRGNAYFELEHYERAIEDYDRAIEFDIGIIFTYYARGNAYNQSGNTQAAIADFEHYLELSDDPYWRAQAEQQLVELRAEGDE
jgi:tetratricopeptide (TPR) repeat protein